MRHVIAVGFALCFALSLGAQEKPDDYATLQDRIAQVEKRVERLELQLQTIAATAELETPVANTSALDLIRVEVVRKKLRKVNYQNYISWDLVYVAIGLKKPTRAIKGILELTDLFGEVNFRVQWTISDPLQPGQQRTKKGGGFRYNQFDAADRWVLATALADMKARFLVESILYADGTREDFDLEIKDE